jgi:hypothetical protein
MDVQEISLNVRSPQRHGRTFWQLGLFNSTGSVVHTGETFAGETTVGGEYGNTQIKARYCVTTNPKWAAQCKGNVA